MWKNHESKNNTIKKLIQGSHLEKNLKKKTLNLNSLVDSMKEVNDISISDNVKKYNAEISRLPTSQSSRPRQILPRLKYDEKNSLQDNTIQS